MRQREILEIRDAHRQTCSNPQFHARENDVVSTARFGEFGIRKMMQIAKSSKKAVFRRW